MSVSQNYIEQYQELHSRDPLMFSGQQSLFTGKYLENLINLVKAKTVLDYGCGKGLQYTIKNIHENWGVNIHLFDIGVKELSSKPNKNFDIVSSTDMLEHCETDDIPVILKEINDYATKAVLVSISTREAKKTLPDGRNAHLTVKPTEWWMDKIADVADKPWLILFEGDGKPIDLDNPERNFIIQSIGFKDKDLKKLVKG